jgi:hypothetical protein
MGEDTRDCIGDCMGEDTRMLGSIISPFGLLSWTDVDSYVSRKQCNRSLQEKVTFSGKTHFFAQIIEFCSVVTISTRSLRRKLIEE